ncbi:recombination protein RecR [Marinomonas primoryensis]|uniref:Recombination protein RecR n=2 Tax=Marinomonas TaxID=28253 RepID=A0A2Z4PTW4_9GAMM|nr:MULTISPECIES: recombination mediator RecR [Marinomonas]AWY01028.1 recombination protein RecR [Marinomonas primoryensis]MDE8603491.1 recombination mediator RecR [Marinomonas maritima]QKK80437.1 recombination protein RecR [Marinomonas primoryensis]
MFSPLIKELIESLRCLPGVGPRSAQKMALYLLERGHQGADRLANSLREALDKVGRCSSCRTLTEESECQLCRDPERDAKRLCIVETPADVVAIESAGTYTGRYFVLLGHLSPIDGIGPEELGLDRLEALVQHNEVEEAIIATNSTVEGEATCHYIAEKLKTLNINVSRIAHGVPMGGELEYVDGNTLALALEGRKKL